MLTAGSVVLALTTIGSRAETITLPTFDVVATTPLGGGQINVSQSPFAVWQSSAQDAETFNDTTLPDTLARSAPGVDFRQRLRQRVPARLVLSWFRRDRGHRHAAGAGGLPERHSHQRGVRRRRQLGPHPTNRDRQDDDHRRKPDLRPERARRRGHRDDEGRFQLPGISRFDFEGGSFLRAQEQIQYGKQFGNWSVYMAANQINDGGWRVAEASQLTNFYGDVGYKANGFDFAPATHRGEHSVRRRCLHADPDNCRRIGAASTPFPSKPITRWSCSNGTALMPIRPL